MRGTIKTLKELHGVAFKELEFWLERQEAKIGQEWLEANLVTAYESLNYSRTPLYHKKLDGVGNPSASYCVSYIKKVGENDFERYDLTWEEVPQNFKDLMEDFGYEPSLSVKLKIKKEEKK